MKHTPYIFKNRYLTSNILFQYPKANLDGEVTSGTITWTAEMGTWTLDGNQVDFTWSDASKCKSSCCLDKPLLSPKEPVANLINCKKNCGDNLVC